LASNIPVCKRRLAGNKILHSDLELIMVIRQFVFGLCISLAIGLTAFGQEAETKVVDEVIAVVNDGVITLSQVRRESKNAVDSYVQEGKKREEAQALVDAKQGELIASLINEELLMQRAKEAGFDNDIDAQINQRFASIMKENNLKTIEELYAAMEKTGVNPKDVRENWRKQMVRDQVLQKDLQSKVYWEPSPKQLKEYYEKHKERFTKQETVSFSELFLGFAGRDEAAVRERAKLLYSLLRNGSDFDKIVKDEGDPGQITNGAGKLEKIKVKDLTDKILTPLKFIQVGQYTAPFELDQLGMVILRVDARDAASNDSVFDEAAVRMALLNERMPDEQKKYMSKLRDESYIKINDAYRPIVSPFLSTGDRKEKEKTGN